MSFGSQQSNQSLTLDNGFVINFNPNIANGDNIEQTPTNYSSKVSEASSSATAKDEFGITASVGVGVGGGSGSGGQVESTRSGDDTQITEAPLMDAGPPAGLLGGSGTWSGLKWGGSAAAALVIIGGGYYFIKKKKRR